MADGVKYRMRCSVCGSHEVTRDAVVYWDFRRQAWIPKSILARGNCKECGSSGPGLVTRYDPVADMPGQQDIPGLLDNVDNA